MARRCLPCVCVVLAGLFLLWSLPAVSAQEAMGKLRVQDMKGRWYEGEVERLAGGGYRIKLPNGITVRLRENEVKTVRPFEEDSEITAPAESAEVYSFRRHVADEEIEELLEGITISTDDILETGVDMMDELPIDEDSLAEMLRLAGTEDYLVMEHVVMVYTSEEEEARRLAARLESVWRWNVKFMRMLDLPMRRPEYKLETFFFGKHSEFQTYGVNTSGRPSGALGYYTPSFNRSCFFDLHTYPPLARILEYSKDTHYPYKRRRYYRNIVNRWVEYNNMVVIQHEIGHHIHFNIGLFPLDVFIDKESYDSIPRWLGEGTTMMFEFPPTAAGASLGATNHGRLDEFDKIYGRKDERRRLSPQQLKSFILDNSIFLRGGGATYSLGWALVNYMWKKNRDGYAAYLKIISEREPGVAISYTEREKEFEDIFGRVNEDWINDWYEFLDGLHLKKSVLPPDLRP